MGALNNELGFNLTTRDPINSTPYNVGVSNPPTPSPPSTDLFLLLDGTDFLLLDGTDFLLL